MMCKNCGKIISKKAKRCKPCHNTHTKKGVSNPNCAMFGDKNPMKNPIKAKIHHDSLRRGGKMKGKNNPNYGGKCYNGKKTKYNNIYFRSSWEVIVAKWLDKNKLIWKYEPQRFFFKNEDFTYLPDFYVEQLNSYIEVKGFWTFDSKRRVEAFKKYYPTLKLIIIDGNNINEFKEVN